MKSDMIDGGGSVESVLKITGMHCSGCAELLNDVISDIKGVKKVNVDFKKGTALLEIENESVLEEVKKGIKAQGYGIA